MINQDLLDKSEDELLAEIGLALSESDLMALPESAKHLRKKASQWIVASWDSITSQICANQIIRQLAEDGFSAELVSAVAALLESLSLGSAVTPLAVLLCRRELKHICRDYWGQDSLSKRNGIS